MNTSNLGPLSASTIPQLAAMAAAHYGDRVAIEEEDGGTLTYNQLNAQAQRCARSLLALGVQPGDRVAVWAPNSAQWIIVTLGLQRIGAILIPINTRMKGAEAAYALNKSGARVLFTVRGFLGIDYPELLNGHSVPQLRHTVVLSGAKPGDSLPNWESFLAIGVSVSDAQVNERAQMVRTDDISDIMFTSGTTGNPKGVMTAHGQNIRVFRTWSGELGLRESDRYLIVSPFFHVFGYKAGWLAALLRGATILPHAVFDARKILERIAADRISVLPGPPTLYQTIMGDPDFARFDLSSLRLAITGAAPVPVELVHRMRKELHFKTVLTAYGLTESCGVISMCTPEDTAETISGTSGRPIEGIEMRLVDDQNRDVPVGTEGEVLARGYNIMKGYYEDEEETRKAIDADGWLHTGDIAVMNDRGYIQITDRKKDMFIVGGFNCYPAEIERLLCNHPSVLQAAVIGVPHERMGEVGKAFVVLRPGHSLTEAELLEWSSQNMANYKVPRSIEFRAALPLNPANKVQKSVLRDEALGRKP